jgi:hypothetical protein
MKRRADVGQVDGDTAHPCGTVDGTAGWKEGTHIGDRVVDDVPARAPTSLDRQRLVEVARAGRIDADERDVAAVDDGRGVRSRPCHVGGFGVDVGSETDRDLEVCTDGVEGRSQRVDRSVEPDGRDGHVDILPAYATMKVQRAGRVAAALTGGSPSGRRRGRSGLRRAGCWREPGRGDLSVQGNREQTADGSAGFGWRITGKGETVR